MAERIHYPEAMDITGRSRGYLRKLVRQGVLTMIESRDTRRTWLSRQECEHVYLAEYHRRLPTPHYWLTITEASRALGIARSNAHKARHAGRLPAQQARNGDWLVRRIDVDALLVLSIFAGPKLSN